MQRTGNQIAKTQLGLMLPLRFGTAILSLSPPHIPLAHANLQANLLVLQLFAAIRQPPAPFGFIELFMSAHYNRFIIVGVYKCNCLRKLV